MQTFKNLVFKKHLNDWGFDKHAILEFDNNYGVSVISGLHAYTDEANPYEVAILFDGKLTYNTHLTDDVIRYCNVQKVTKIMKQVQNLK